MFVIRNVQLDALRDALNDAFFSRLAEWARLEFWETFAGMDAKAVLVEVRGMAQRAFSHGISREDDVQAFVVLALLHGPSLSSPWALLILDDVSIPGGAKVALLRRRLGGA